MRLMALAALMALTSGCSMSGGLLSNDNYQNAQRDAVVHAGENYASLVAMMIADTEPVSVEGSTGPDFRLTLDLRPFALAMAGVFEHAPKPIVNEGYTWKMMGRDVLLGIADKTPLGLLAYGLTRYRPDVTVSGDGNAVDMSQLRQYSLAQGGGDARFGDDDYRTDYDNDKRTYSDVANSKPIDSRQNYDNDHSATATPTIVEQDRAVVVRPEVVPTATASPFVYNAEPVEAQ